MNRTSFAEYSSCAVPDDLSGGGFLEPVHDVAGAESSLASMMRGVAHELDAAGLLVTRHRAELPPTTLLANWSGPADGRTEREMTTLSAHLAGGKGVDRQSASCHCRNEPGELTAVAIPLPDGLVTVTGLFKASGTACRNELLRLVPLLQPFFRLWSAEQDSAVKAAGLATAVDHSEIATFLVNRQCEVLFANQAAEVLIGASDGVAVTAGRIAGSSLAETLRLQAAIEHTCGGGGADRVTPIIALRRRKRRPLMLTLVSAAAQDARQQELVVAYAFDPEQDLSRFIEPACKFYGLSASETRLTCRLADGGSLGEAAAALGVREQTARSYLKQIFLKTETNRQAELVWLMLKSAVRISCPSRTEVF